MADDEAADTADWHALELEAVYDRLDTGPTGLTDEEAARRLERYGPNELEREEGASVLALFVSQFQDVLIYLLILAAALSLVVGLLPGFDPHYTDAALIALILLANGVFGFVQDYQAERSIEALRAMAAPKATVLRDGERRTVDATAVVPGDVLVVEQGDAIPADARVIEGHSLQADESALTGESASVSKAAGPVDAAAPLAERENLLHMHTTAVKGRGRAVVTATGMATEVGGIATQLAVTEDEPTPFQVEVDQLGRQIGLGVVGLIVLIAAVQLLFTAASPISVLLVGVTLAVAAVPEGLPAVVTLTLALGSRRMAARKALVRRLPVVESLGSVDVIVTDKTGTLTENRMTVRRIAVGEATYEVSGAGTERDGAFTRDGEEIDPAALEPVLRCGAVCNNAELGAGDDDRGFHGDPTEVAVLAAAAKAGVDADHDRLRELPFSSERARMTVVADGDPPTAYMKGAPEEVLDRCDRVLIDGEAVDLTDARRAAILERNEAFAADALRVLGFASKPVDDPDADEASLETGLTFLGLQGMLDPPRPEVAGAIADCRRAGVRVVMVTGDNAGTAKAIGEEVGFDPAGALTGADVEGMDEDALAEAVESVDIFARAAPEHKVRVLDALQANGHDVAMTGDGVNDAPALRSADVGIAMGIRGTDVAQGAADMVLQDDNFATIRDAIAEGRGIFDNIRKFVNYLLSANAGEVLVVFLGVLLGSLLFPEQFASRSEALILTPVMLLWINLVTDGLPALALGVDPKAEGILDRPPRGADEPVIDRRLLASILAIGLLMTATGLGLFFYGLSVTGSLVAAQTLLFTFLVVVEIVRIQVIRRRYALSWRSNRWLLAAIGVTVVLQLLVLYTPANRFFGVRPLALAEWTWIAVAFVAFLALNLVVSRGLDRLVPADRAGR
ncbi:MAG: cation-transporting P-type ATPase [Halobacteriales archaeon]|nr:cation-transporting P-type ATPase [Halobacteriales archaeon]